MCTYENPNKKRGPPSAPGSKPKSRSKKQNIAEKRMSDTEGEEPSLNNQNANGSYGSTDSTRIPSETAPNGELSPSTSSGSMLTDNYWTNFQQLDVDHLPLIPLQDGSEVEWLYLYFKYINAMIPLFSEYEFDTINSSAILLHFMYLITLICPNVAVSEERIEKYFQFCQILQENSSERPDPTTSISLYLMSLFKAIKYPLLQNANVGIKLSIRYGQQIAENSGPEIMFRFRDHRMVSLESKKLTMGWCLFKTLAFDYENIISIFLNAELCCPRELDMAVYVVLPDRSAYNHYLDGEIAFFHALLINLIKRNIKFLRRGYSSREVVQDFGLQLQEWKNGLPEHLIPKLDLNKPREGGNVYMRAYVHALYNFCLLLLNLEQFFEDLKIGYLESPQINTCVSAIYEIERLLAYLGFYTKQAILVLPQHSVFSFYIAVFATALVKHSHQKGLKDVIQRQYSFINDYPAFFPGQISESFKWMKQPKRTLDEIRSLIT